MTYYFINVPLIVVSVVAGGVVTSAGFWTSGN
ncbi:hypothetical protein T08_8538 [Trichinella sp. T8]|nr:hypothetical protein T08_8538 [Trichinella sp. T8]